MELFIVGDKSEGRIVAVINLKDSAFKLDASSLRLADHLLPGDVVGEVSVALVQHKPSVLPALHHVRPFGERTFQRG